MSDPRTLAFYAERAAEYRDRFGAHGAPDADLRAFLAVLPREGRVLDLGCGPGNAALKMQAAGLHVTATDAVPEMVAIAQAAGVDARVATFDALDEEDAFDGVWANFSLLHAPRAAMPRHLAAVARALRRGGHLHLGLKTGTGARRDGLGRLYTYYTPEELETLLQDAGFAVVRRREGAAEGFAGGPEPYIIAIARKI